MKKITILLLLLLLFVTGCGSNITSIDITKTSKMLDSKLGNMEKLNKDALETVYGLSLDKIETYIIKKNDNGDLYALIKTNDPVTIKDDMETFFSKIKEFNTAYSPERIEILENRIEREIGQYLIYIVSENADELYNEIINMAE